MLVADMLKTSGLYFIEMAPKMFGPVWVDVDGKAWSLVIDTELRREGWNKEEISATGPLHPPTFLERQT